LNFDRVSRKNPKQNRAAAHGERRLRLRRCSLGLRVLNGDVLIEIGEAPDVVSLFQLQDQVIRGIDAHNPVIAFKQAAIVGPGILLIECCL
jgi:hypothetical protein